MKALRHTLAARLHAEACRERAFVCRFDDSVPGVELRFHQAVRADDGGEVMNILYLIAGAVAVLLFVYLVLALLHPEWFG